MSRNCDMLATIPPQRPSRDGQTAMKTLMRRLGVVSMLVTASLSAPLAQAQEKVLNLYSARHYQTDEALYANFTKATGIRINRIEAGDEQLLERLRSEGANSPADVLLIVDASRLHNAQQLGLFQPVKSALLESRIPATLRDPGGDRCRWRRRREGVPPRPAGEGVPQPGSDGRPAGGGRRCRR